jgi:hypothetical protein
MTKLHFIPLKTTGFLLVAATDNDKLYNFNIINPKYSWSFDNTEENDSGFMQTDIIDRNYMYGEFNLQNWREYFRDEIMYDLIESTFNEFESIVDLVNGNTSHEGEEKMEILQELLKLQLSL